jgi:thiol-disulfide isomerase/thioredoxin
VLGARAVGSHSVSALGLALLVFGCDQTDKKPPFVTRERSQAIVAASTAASAAAPSSVDVETSKALPGKVGGPSHTSVKSSPQAPRKLCEGKLSKLGHALPKAAISRAAAPGTPEPPSVLPLQGGIWTWVNFWAAWCVPCKEEIPRLKAWEARLKASGKSFQVLFVSLDDDARQLQDFLKTQPASGLRATYWLKEGKEREDWLKGVEISSDPGLPMHLLVDARGKVRCTIDGAVEDTDFEQLTALIGR